MRVEMAPPGQLRLVIVDGDAFRTEPLPQSGVVTIGRSSTCDVVIDNQSISRLHARLTIGEQLTIEDVGSANGTRIGERVLEEGEPVQFEVGEALSLGTITIVVQKSAAQSRAKRIWPHGYFEGRLAEECLRSDRVRSQFAVARLVAGRDADPKLVEEALSTVVRGIDVLGTYAPGEYEVLLTDCSRDVTEKVVDRLVAQLGARGVAITVGIACYPSDGRTADELIARAGSRGAPSQPSTPARDASVSTMGQLEVLTQRVAAASISVVILGETGAGKDVLAARIHALSRRAHAPFLALNCASLSESLLESELFGHERGAFTGADRAKAGLLETADGGTVFLDEIGDMPISIQVKLLRVLEDRLVLRIGAVKPKAIDVRFIAATNRDLEADVERGVFRRDLFFRLNGITLEVPPLRERQGEIEGLARAFAAENALELGYAGVPSFAADTLALLREYPWPGNVRELRNVIERALVLCRGERIDLEHLPLEKMHATLPPARRRAGDEPRQQPRPARVPTEPPSERSRIKTAPVVDRDAPERPTADLKGEIAALERARISQAMESSGGNQKKAAEQLGISRRTLINRLDAFGIKRPRKS